MNTEALTLAQLILRAREFAEEERLPFAQVPWVPTSAVIWSDNQGTASIEKDGVSFAYFLEPFIIVEQFDGVLGDPDTSAVVDRVIRYAADDA